MYIAGRNAGLADAAIDELRRDTGNEARFLALDLADLRSVKKAAQEFMRSVVLYPPKGLSVADELQQRDSAASAVQQRASARCASLARRALTLP